MYFEQPILQTFIYCFLLLSLFLSRFSSFHQTRKCKLKKTILVLRNGRKQVTLFQLLYLILGHKLELLLCMFQLPMTNFQQYSRIIVKPMKEFLSCKQAFQPIKKQLQKPSIQFKQTLKTRLCSILGSIPPSKTFYRMLDN